jgi:hypothetical protein
MKPIAPPFAPARQRLPYFGLLDSHGNSKAAAIALAVLAAGLSTAVAREWTPVRSPTSQDLTSVHFSNSQDGFAAGAFGAL